jgi:branched-subunit amino acid permease
MAGTAADALLPGTAADTIGGAMAIPRHGSRAYAIATAYTIAGTNCIL